MFSSLSGKSTGSGRVDVVAVAGGAAALSGRKAGAPMQRAESDRLGQRGRLLGQLTQVEVAGGAFQTVEGLRHALRAEAEPGRRAGVRRRRGAAGGRRGAKVRVGIGRRRSDAVPPVAAARRAASRRRRRAPRGPPAFRPALSRRQPLLLLLLGLLVAGRRTPSGTDDGMRYVGQSQDDVHYCAGCHRKLTVGQGT